MPTPAGRHRAASPLRPQARVGTTLALVAYEGLPHRAMRDETTTWPKDGGRIMRTKCLVLGGAGGARAVPAANAQLENTGRSVGSLTGPAQHVQGAPSDAQVGLEVQAQLRQKTQVANFNST